MIGRSYGPVMLEGIEGTPVHLERVAGKDWSTLAAGNVASESSLQSVLATCPHLLPLGHFSSVYSPAVCIAREAPTKAGPIDLLYLSNQGRVILVETKLHRNPESRREVLAQLLDYAAQVAQWSYDDLDRVAERWHVASGKTDPWPGLARWHLERFADTTDPEDAAATAKDDASTAEEELVLEIERNLRRGEILGLVVADEIRRRTENLVSYANQLPGLSLELGLVELAFYRRPGSQGPLFVMPSVSQRTAIVERVVVDVRVEAAGLPVTTRVDRQRDAAAAASPDRKPRLASAERFLDRAREHTTPPVLEYVKRVVGAFAEIEAEYGDLYELDYSSANCSLYWRQTDEQTRRIMSVNDHGRFRFFSLYLKYAEADDARRKLAEVGSRVTEMDENSVGTIYLDEKNIGAVLSAAKEAAAAISPLLLARPGGL